MNLSARDLEMFDRLRIPPSLLELAHIERVTDAEARERYGIVGSGDMSGIAFPYFSPTNANGNGPHRWTCRVRRDHPEIEGGKPKRKYMAAYGDRRHLFFPPRSAELLQDTSVPIVLVEAEKSALALLAWSERTGIKFLPVATAGCWGWRGRIGKVENSEGERVDEVGPIPDLACANHGRRVYVLLDSNANSNSKVQQARAALCRQLRKQEADVASLDLPSGDGINGPDDYLGVMGDEAMTALFEGAGEGEKVLNEMVSFLRQYVILSEGQATAIALWIAHTYTFESAAWSPYLNVTSAAPECGKSLLLETLEFLVRKPWKVDGASPAVLFRKIERDQPTLLFDELDTTFKGDRETAQAIRQVLNAGAKYNGTVARCVGEHHTPKDFRVFSPKVLAGIGDLPPTVSSRSLPIVLGRKLATEKVDYLDHGDLAIKSRAAELRNRVSDWIEKRAEGFRHITPEFPEALTDRQKDGSRILLTIADAAGGEWPVRARAVLCELYGARPVEDQSIGIQLLRDARSIFDETEAEKITSGDFVEKLAKIETSPWAEWNHGKTMTAVGLSRLLKPFKIFPKKIRTGDGTLQGYERSSFADPWDRYLARTTPPSPTPPFETEHAEQASVYAAETHFSKTEQDASVPGAKSEESSMFMGVVPDVPDQKGGKGHAGDKVVPIYEDLELPCPVHGRHTDWWVRILPDGGEMTCGKCHPEDMKCCES